MVLASAGLHAVWSSLIKGSADSLAFNALLTLGNAALGATLIVAIGPAAIPGEVLAGAAVTGIPHGLYLYFLSRAFDRGDLSLVYPIVRSTPAFLPLLAVPLLGERISVVAALGIAVVVGGIWTMHGQAAAEPSREGSARRVLRSPGTGFAALALLATLFYSLLDKHNMAVFAAADWDEPLPRAVAYFFLLYVAAATVFLPLALRRLPRGALAATWRLRARHLGLAALAGLAGYGLILEAFRSAPASYVVAVRQTSVVFALVIAVALLGERPTRARILGALATLLGVVLIALFP